MSNVNTVQDDQKKALGTLPSLRGSKKQLGWAYKIRDEFLRANPDSSLLTEQTEAKYWIENRASLVDEKRLPRSLPTLKGTERQVKYAFAIRAKFAEIFSESKLLNSQTDSVFWIENRQMFDFAILGFQSAAPSEANEDSLSDRPVSRDVSQSPVTKVKKPTRKGWAKIESGIRTIRGATR